MYMLLETFVYETLKKTVDKKKARSNGQIGKMY
jgi:hypothetical protein